MHGSPQSIAPIQLLQASNSASASPNNTLGPLLIGIVISAILYGINSLQLYLYYTRYSARDSIFLKATTTAVWLFDGSHQGLTLITLYYYAISHFGDRDVLGTTTWSLEANCFINGIMAAVVQLFYAWRIWLLSEKRPLIPIVILILLLCYSGFGLAYTIQLTQTDVGTTTRPPWATIGLSANLACDVVISFSILRLLRQGRLGFKSIHYPVSTVALYAVTTGVTTAIVSAACLITFTVFDGTFIYAPFLFVLCRFYAISMISMLNSREFADWKDYDDSAVSFSSVHFNNTNTGESDGRNANSDKRSGSDSGRSRSQRTGSGSNGREIWTASSKG